MKCDIVFPTIKNSKSNEEEFISLAKDLGFDALIFAYDNSKKFYKHQTKQTNSKFKIFNAIITSPNKIQSNKKFANLILTKSTGADREIFERYKPNLIFAVEEMQKKDFMHQRGSGLNGVFAKLAKKNNVLFAFSFHSILSNEKTRERIIGKMMQNIKLCRKYKVTTSIASFATNPYEMRAYHDLIAFFTNLGMHPKEAKDSFKSAIKRLNINGKK